MPHHDPTEFPEPTYQEATEGWQRCQAENTRLQSELKAAKWTLEMDDPRLLKAVQTIARLIAERDGYAAALEARLDCGKDADCADEIETQEQCKKHYELYVEREIAEALAGKAGYAAALDRLQKRFNEIWKQHQRMLYALENARDVIHRANCPAPASLPQKCWKECEEAMDAMLEAGWVQP